MSASVLFPLVLSGLALAACASLPAEEVAEVTPSPTVTPAPFDPTITPVPTPTDLPPVTPPTQAPTPTLTATPTRDPTIASVQMQPNLGELGERVTVTGFGYVPDSTVELYWARLGSAPTGNPFDTATTDADGEFRVEVTIPSIWPGGPPEDHAFLELRVIGDENREAWASYAYVVPFKPFVAPEGTYTNTTYGYAVDLPPDWVANEANPANVMFGPEDETHVSFIRVLGEGDLNAAIDGLLAEVAPGQAHDSQSGLLGAQEGQRVEIDDGRVYWFLQNGGQTYVLHFEAADADVADFTYTTFRFTG